jgi:hypothetical protein
MGKHAADNDKIAFMVYLQYVDCATTTARATTALEPRIEFVPLFEHEW